MEPESLTVAFINAATDYLVTLDLQGRVVFANRAFRNTFLGETEPKGVDFISLVDAESASRFRDALSAMDSGARQIEVVHKTRDGRIHPVHYSLCRMDLEDLRLVGAVGRNKTADLELLGEITQLNLELENKQSELAEAYARLEQLAVTDQITGLYNRHYFFTVAALLRGSTSFGEEASMTPRPHVRQPRAETGRPLRTCSMLTGMLENVRGGSEVMWTMELPAEPADCSGSSPPQACKEAGIHSPDLLPVAATTYGGLKLDQREIGWPHVRRPGAAMWLKTVAGRMRREQHEGRLPAALGQPGEGQRYGGWTRN